MKYNLLIISFFILFIACSNISAGDNYVISDNTVYMDNEKVCLSATPHTLSSSGWVYFNLTSKVYTGKIDAFWGFNTTVAKLIKAELYKPHWINTTTDHHKTFYNSSFIVYTDGELDYGNSYNTNYRYTVIETINGDNGTIYITSNVAFDSFDMDGTNYTVYWYTRYDNYYLWEDFSSSFNSVIHDYKGFDKWYYIKNVPVITGENYTVRGWVDVPVSIEKQTGKYYFAIKPSHETISQAINNGHFYNLDPWWNAIWDRRKEIILTGGTSDAQMDYQLLLNITFDSDMQSDFDDLRFTNETHTLDSWLESKVDGSYALIWVEFPTTPANGINQTYYLYYGNVGAVSDYDIGATFLFGDDFSGTSLDTNKWDTAVSVGCSVSVGNGELSLDAPMVASDNTHAFIATKTFTFQKAVFAMRMKSDATHYMHSSCGSGSNCLTGSNKMIASGYYFMGYMPGSRRIRSIASDCSVLEISAGADGGVWTSYTIHENVICDDVSNNIRKLIDGNIINQATNSTYLTNDKKISISQSEYSARGGITKIDWLYVRKYAASPPTYAVGSEDEYSLLDELKAIMSEITVGLKSINMGNYLVYTFILIGILLIILLIRILNNCIYRG